MLDNIKITILGTTGSGKTCYLLGMYSKMQMGIEGFSLHTKDFNTHIELSEKIAVLIHEGKDRRWPPPNFESIECSFDFCYGLKPIMGIEWLDYRGAAMSTPEETVDANDVPGFREFLKDSSCVFICVPGEFLLEPIVKYNEGNKQIDRNKLHFLRRKARVNHILEYMMALAASKKPTRNNPFPVVITITKYDYCLKRAQTEEGRGSIIEDIKEIFNTLFAPQSGFLVTICPVSLDKELAHNLEQGEIDPINFHIPLLFAAFSFFRKRYLNEHKENDKKWMKLLGRELYGVSTYCNGREVEINV